MSTSRQTQVALCLAATWILWGSTFLAIKIALPEFPPFFQMGSRFLCAGIALLSWLSLKRREALPSARQWLNALIVGGLLLVGGGGGTAYAEQSVASGLAAAFIAVEPAMMVCGHWAFGRVPTRGEVFGILLGLCGVMLLVSGSGFAASRVGLSAMAIAALSWSVGSVLEVERLRTAPELMGAASQMICGGGLLLVISAGSGEQLRWPSLSSVPEVECKVGTSIGQTQLLGKIHMRGCRRAAPVGERHYIIGTGGRFDFQIEDIRIVVDIVIGLHLFELAPSRIRAATEEIDSRQKGGNGNLLATI